MIACDLLSIYYETFTECQKIQKSCIKIIIMSVDLLHYLAVSLEQQLFWTYRQIDLLSRFSASLWQMMEPCKNSARLQLIFFCRQGSEVQISIILAAPPSDAICEAQSKAFMVISSSR